MHGTTDLPRPFPSLEEALLPLCQKEKTPSSSALYALTKKADGYIKHLEQKLEGAYIEIEYAQQKISEHYFKDVTTNLPNRYSFLNEIKSVESIFLAVIDVHAFQSINETYGMDISRKLLQKIALELLARSFENKLFVYSFGSDIFGLVSINMEDKKEFICNVNHVVTLIENRSFDVENIEIDIDFRIGFSFERENIIDKAWQALQEAKKRKKPYMVYNSTMDSDEQQLKNLEMVRKIKFALKEENFFNYYQPIVNRDKKIIKYESLLRMKDNGGVLSPYHFLDIALNTKYYSQISEGVIRQCFEYFLDKKEMFAINLNINDILNERIKTLIFTLIEAFPEPERIQFELLESENIENIQEVTEFIQKVQSNGVSIAIDDFGTGYSNFAYILSLRPNVIKVDGSLIKNLTENKTSYHIVKNIVNFAKELGIKTTAEFIESETIFEAAKELGFDCFQGYYFGKPSEHVIGESC